MEIWDKRTLSDLRMLSASEEDFRQLLSDFFSDVSFLVQQIQINTSDNLAQNIIKAHTLKGLAYSFGAVYLAQTAKNVEQHLRSSEPISQAVISQLNIALEKSQKTITQLL